MTPEGTIFGWDPLRAKHALKTVLAALVGVNLAMQFHWSNPYWTVITCFIVMLPILGASVQKGILRLTGTVLGALSGVVLVALFPQTQLGLCLALLAVILAAMQFADSNYAVFLGLGTLAMVAFVGIVNPPDLWHVASYRSAEIGLGVLVATFVNTFLWPRKAGDEVRRLLGGLLREMQSFSAALFPCLLDGEDPARQAGVRGAAWEKRLLTRFPAVRRMLDFACQDSDAVRRRRGLHDELLLALRELFNALAALDQCSEPARLLSAGCRGEFAEELRAFRLAVHEAFEQLAAAVESGRLQGESGVPAAFERFGRRLDALRRLGVTRLHPTPDVLNLLALSDALRQLDRCLGGARSAVEALAGPGRPARGKAAARRERWAGPDPDKVRRGARIGVGFLATLYAWFALQWPSGVQTMISFFIIMAQPSIPAVNHKILLRLAGALIGCAFAVASAAFVLPYLSSMYSLSVLLFVVLGICAYVHAGPDRTSYLGLQAAICFSLTMAHDVTNDVTVVTALQRAAGILAGALCASLAVRFLWPPVPGRELVKQLVRTFELMRSALEGDRGARFSEEAVANLARRLPACLDHCHAWLGQMRFYRGGEKERVGELLDHLQRLGFKLLALCQAHQRARQDPTLERFRGLLARFQEAMGKSFEDCGGAFLGRARVETGPLLDRLLRELEQEALRVREERAFSCHATCHVLAYGSVLEAYRGAAEGIRDCRKKIDAVDLGQWSFEIPL